MMKSDAMDFFLFFFNSNAKRLYFKCKTKICGAKKLMRIQLKMTENI